MGDERVRRSDDRGRLAVWGKWTLATSPVGQCQAVLNFAAVTGERIKLDPGRVEGDGCSGSGQTKWVLVRDQSPSLS